MSSPDPLVDSNRTVAHEVNPEPDTLDVSQELATGASVANLPTGLANAPRIPGYRISGEIATGGMGRVYAAIDETLDREVAIKTLLAGANPERFVVEAKITAKLPHPNIPPVHALGTLENGVPWLAMKLICGRTLAELLKERTSPSCDLLRFIQIFEQIAQAVGFAHSRGILHRDLKPLNVMVGEFGEVQVMDWGLAKDTHQPASLEHEAGQSLFDGDNAQHTAAGTVMGTPGYMAPEQARGEAVDARADVFALGSILAVILTDKPAFVSSTVRETMMKAVNADLTEALARLDACGADPDLIALAQRCMAARPEDRPADGRTAAAEVAAYRAGVEQRLRQAEMQAAEALVREGEQRKRRQALLAAGGVIVVVLVAGIIGTTIGLLRANAAADQERIANAAAQDEKIKAENAKAAEVVARQQAQKRLIEVEKGIEMFAGMLEGINPRAEDQGGEPLYVQLRKRAEKAADDLDPESVADPLAVARLQTILGNTLRELGNASKGAIVLEKAVAIRDATLGAEHPESLTSRNNLALAYKDAGRLGEALPLLEATFKVSEARLGAEHPETLNRRSNLATTYYVAGRINEALLLYEATLKAQEKNLGADHPTTLRSRNNLAAAYFGAGRHGDAVPLYEATLKAQEAKLGADHPSTLSSRNNLALAYKATGRLNEALSLYEATLKANYTKLGADHPDTLQSRNNLALALQAAGRHGESLPLLESTLKVREAKLGSDHPDTLQSRNNLATAYYSAGRLGDALPLFEATLKAQEAKLGADHPSTLASRNNLGVAYNAAGRHVEAVPLFEATLKARETKLGVDHPDTLQSRNNLGNAYAAAGQGKKAAETLSAFIDGTRQRFPKDNLQFASLLAQTSLELLKCDQFATAEYMLRESLAICEKTQPEVWSTFNIMSVLGGAILSQKKYAEAEPLLLKGYEGMKAREGTIPPSGGGELRILEALDRLIALYTATDKPHERKKYQDLRANLQPKKETP